MGFEQKQNWKFEIDFYESILAKDPKYAEVIEMLAHLYTKVGRIDDGLAMDERLVALEPHKSINHYNLACSYALKDRYEDALKALQKAIHMGYKDVEWMEEDKDLEPLHAYPEFKKLIAQLKAKA